MTGHDLTTFRKSLDWTQAQLAEKLRVAPNTVSRWEIGERPIPWFMPILLDWVRSGKPVKQGQ